MKKLLVTAAVGLSVLAAPLAASAHPYGGYDRGGDRAGAAIAAGVFGLILGAAIADSGPHYAAPPYAYDQRSDYDSGYGYGYGYDSGSGYGSGYERCWWQPQPYRDYWGHIEYRQVEVCR